MWSAARLMLGEEASHIHFCYWMNMEVYSLILAWACEFEPEVEKIRLTLTKLIDGEYLINLDSILEWVVPQIGIHIKEGDDQEELMSFVHGPKDDIKDQCRERARIGWEAMKLCVKLIQTDEVLKALKVVEWMEVGRELQDRFEEGWVVQLLVSLEGDPDFGCLECILKMKSEAARGKASADKVEGEKVNQSESE